ncbi:hypothetical protein [Umezawaea sp. NPDC059074]|uniref:hypothetical protein n=1 Tax=Umezawaea sp. NPDC059074 TaxID=3346716 RepID=UPI00369CEF41
MGARRWWLGAVVFGAVAAMTVTSALVGAERTRDEAAVVTTTTSSSPPPTTTTTVPPPPPPETTAEEPVATAEAEQSPPLEKLAAGIDVGALVVDRQTGKPLSSFYPDQQFDSASLVKVLIALDALSSGAGDPASVARMLATSDDDEASRLWAARGGGRIVVAWAKRIGLSGTEPPADDNRWGDTLTTASDVARVYQYLFEDPDGQLVVKALDGMTDFGADGFDQRFGLPVAAGDRPWAVKQGWSCCRGHRTLHTSGLLGDDQRYVVVVLTAQPASTSEKAAKARITQITAELVKGL